MKVNSTKRLSVIHDLYSGAKNRSYVENNDEMSYRYNFTDMQELITINISDCMELWDKDIFEMNRNWTATERIQLFMLCFDKPSTSEVSTRPFILYWWQQMFWSIVFGLMILVALVGNAITIWIVLAHRRMRTVTNYFLVNLSTADFAMALFNTTFNFVFMLNSHWPFGHLYCIINTFIAYLTVSSSVLTIMAVSLERYVVTLRPLLPRMTKKIAVGVILGIWLSGALLSLPTLLYSTTITYTYQDGTLRTLCLLIWPDGPAGTSKSDYAYNIAFSLLTYGLPITSMAVAYISMSRVLWRQTLAGESTPVQPETIKSKRRVVRMLTGVVVIFGVCWLPYHIYFLYTYHDKEFVKAKFVQHLYLSIYWLAMANAMFNPLIYCWTNQRFKRYFQEAVCRWRDKQQIRHNPVPTRRNRLAQPQINIIQLNALVEVNGHLFN
ncbi:tachykinin-like peptides receptor 86C [Tachypleus tridentatus]|uniref:tachykinin-like peptides receptor 86C n=1 Tax=Tachypleus tridentatus TaxID=6853 RepID=UPI003FD219EE